MHILCAWVTLKLRTAPSELSCDDLMDITPALRMPGTLPKAGKYVPSQAPQLAATAV